MDTRGDHYVFFSGAAQGGHVSPLPRPGCAPRIGFMNPLCLTRLDFLTNKCILLPALVRKYRLLARAS